MSISSLELQSPNLATSVRVWIVSLGEDPSVDSVSLGEDLKGREDSVLARDSSHLITQKGPWAANCSVFHLKFQVSVGRLWENKGCLRSRSPHTQGQDRV